MMVSPLRDEAWDEAMRVQKRTGSGAWLGARGRRSTGEGAPDGVHDPVYRRGMNWRELLGVAADVAQVVSVVPLVVLAWSVVRDRWERRGGPNFLAL